MDDKYKLIIDNDTMRLALDFYLGVPNVHFEFKIKPTHNLIKFVRDEMLEELLIILGTHGYEVLFAVIPQRDEKLKRFCKLMHFEEEVTTNGYTFLAQDIV